MTFLKDGIEQSRPFFEEPILKADSINQLQIEGSKKAIKCLLEHLKETPWDGLDPEIAKELINKSAKSAGVKKGLVMKSLRACLLGCMQGPDLMITWSLLARIRQDFDRLCKCI